MPQYLVPGDASVLISQQMTEPSALQNLGPGTVYLDPSSAVSEQNASLVLVAGQVATWQGGTLYARASGSTSAQLVQLIGAGASVVPFDGVVTGDVGITGPVEIDGTVNVAGAVDVAGSVTIDNATINATVTGNVEVDGGTVNIGGVLTPVTVRGGADYIDGGVAFASAVNRYIAVDVQKDGQTYASAIVLLQMSDSRAGIALFAQLFSEDTYDGVVPTTIRMPVAETSIWDPLPGVARFGMTNAHAFIVPMSIARLFIEYRATADTNFVWAVFGSNTIVSKPTTIPTPGGIAAYQAPAAPFSSLHVGVPPSFQPYELTYEALNYTGIGGQYDEFTPLVRTASWRIIIPEGYLPTGTAPTGVRASRLIGGNGLAGRIVHSAAGTSSVTMSLVRQNS